MMLLTQANKNALKKNVLVPEADRKPVVKFFTPWANATWLLSEFDEARNEFYGLCDLGLGMPELGYVSLDELESINGPFGLKIERDRGFSGQKLLSEYAEEAREKGYVY